MSQSGLNWPSRIPRLLWMRRECPLCNSFEFKMAESGVLDGILALLSLRPVRCANCWRRYYWFARQG